MHKDSLYMTWPSKFSTPRNSLPYTLMYHTCIVQWQCSSVPNEFQCTDCQCQLTQSFATMTSQPRLMCPHKTASATYPPPNTQKQPLEHLYLRHHRPGAVQTTGCAKNSWLSGQDLPRATCFFKPASCKILHGIGTNAVTHHNDVASHQPNHLGHLLSTAANAYSALWLDHYRAACKGLGMLHILLHISACHTCHTAECSFTFRKTTNLKQLVDKVGFLPIISMVK